MPALPFSTEWTFALSLSKDAHLHHFVITTIMSARTLRRAATSIMSFIRRTRSYTPGLSISAIMRAIRSEWDMLRG